MPFSYRRSVNPRIVEAYRSVALWLKIVLGATFVALATVGGMQTFPDQTLVIAEASAAVVLGIHFTLSYPNIIKVSMAWLINMVLITASSILAALTVTVDSDAGWVFMSWVAVQFLASLTMMFLAMTRLRGKLWLTLFMAWVAMFITSLVTLVVLRSSDAALLVGVAFGFLIVAMRMIFPLRRSMQLPAENSSLLSKASTLLEKYGFHAKTADTRHGGSFVISVNNQGQIVTVDAANVSTPLSFDKHGQVHYMGKSLAGWLAQSIIEVESSLPKGVPFTHFIVFDGDNSLGDRPRFISLTPLNGGMTRTVCLINGAKGVRAIPEVIRELKATPASAGEVTRLKFSSK